MILYHTMAQLRDTPLTNLCLEVAAAPHAYIVLYDTYLYPTLHSMIQPKRMHDARPPFTSCTAIFRQSIILKNWLEQQLFGRLVFDTSESMYHHTTMKDESHYVCTYDMRLIWNFTTRHHRKQIKQPIIHNSRLVYSILNPSRCYNSNTECVPKNKGFKSIAKIHLTSLVYRWQGFTSLNLLYSFVDGTT